MAKHKNAIQEEIDREMATTAAKAGGHMRCSGGVARCDSNIPIPDVMNGASLEHCTCLACLQIGRSIQMQLRASANKRIAKYNKRIKQISK